MKSILKILKDGKIPNDGRTHDLQIMRHNKGVSNATLLRVY